MATLFGMCSVFLVMLALCLIESRKSDRTDAIRNGQVPAVVRLAWHVLSTPRRSERAEI
jgi:hypothetical protein